MNSSPSSSATGNSKAKLYLIGAVVALLLGAILYFVGLQAGKAQLATQKATFDVERNGLQSKITTANGERDAARERAALMEARGALYRAAIDLDARNFGTANTHLKEAATALGAVQKPGIEPLRSQISATDLNVAVNLADQRAKVLDLAGQLNRVMPAATTAPAPDAPITLPAGDVPPPIPPAPQ